MTANPATKSAEEVYLTIRETAQRLRVAPSWVYRRTCTREIPCRKFGRHVRIPLSRLIEWEEVK